MEIEGNIRKMEAVHESLIQYYLPVGEQKVFLNELLGSPVSLEYTGHIHCVRCGRETRKSFAQGYCYPCFTTAPETEECVLQPELCRAHEGIARDMAYAREHCLSEQVVYISLTSGIKVGVTRSSQVPTRWIDQGAIRALELARTPNRHSAGLLEVALKAHLADKTNWRLMLSGNVPEEMDLIREKKRLIPLIPDELKPYATDSMQVLELVYPVMQYPDRIRSLNFDKDRLVSGILTGMKGQYLMLDRNRVINIRKFGGYQVRFRAGV